MTDTPNRVAALGECMIEMFRRPDGSLTMGFGGDTLNTAVYLARLGTPVDYVTALGDDSISEDMIAAWAAEGVGTGHVLRVPNRLPGLYLIETDASGERRFLYWRDRAPARELFALPQTPELSNALEGYGIVYLSGISIANLGEQGRERLFEVLQRVRARGGAVVLWVKGGYATGSGGLSSPSGGVELGFWRPSFSTSLGLVLDLRYFTFGHDETLTTGAITLPVKSDATFIAFEPSLAWRRPLLRGMFWLGGGPGLMRVSTTVAAPGQADLTATSWDLTAHGSVGWGLPIGAGVPFVELKALWKGETDVGAMRGAVKLFSVNLGYRFDVL